MKSILVWTVTAALWLLFSWVIMVEVIPPTFRYDPTSMNDMVLTIFIFSYSYIMAAGSIFMVFLSFGKGWKEWEEPFKKFVQMIEWAKKVE